MAKSKAAYYDLAFKSDATVAVKSYNGLVSHLLQDDAYEKVYPSIANIVLHDRLVEFIRDKDNWPNVNSVGPLVGNIFKKPNGHQIDSSRRYLAVRDCANHIDLYVQITKGRSLGRFKMLTNEQEIAFLLIFGLEWMTVNGEAPIVKDFTKAVVDGNLFVPRERQELVSRTINANILISQTQSKTNIDVTRLGVADAKPTTTKTKDGTSTDSVSSSAASSSSSPSRSYKTNQRSRPATKTKRTTPKTSSTSRSTSSSNLTNTSATSSSSYMNTSAQSNEESALGKNSESEEEDNQKRQKNDKRGKKVAIRSPTHIVKAKTTAAPMTSTKPSAIKDKTKKTTTKPATIQKKNNGASNQSPSSIYQHLRQRKPVATTATAKVDSGSGVAAKSSKGAKKADNAKRKTEDLDDDGLNSSSSKKPKKDAATGTGKTKTAKK